MLEEGLRLSGMGILITFAALGSLVLLILLLKRIFPARRVDEVGFVSGFELDDREKLKEQAAAAAVAALLDQQRGRRRSSLGSLLEEPVGNWWRKNIDRLHREERE